MHLTLAFIFALAPFSIAAPTSSGENQHAKPLAVGGLHPDPNILPYKSFSLMPSKSDKGTIPDAASELSFAVGGPPKTITYTQLPLATLPMFIGVLYTLVEKEYDMLVANDHNKLSQQDITSQSLFLVTYEQGPTSWILAESTYTSMETRFWAIPELHYFGLAGSPAESLQRSVAQLQALEQDSNWVISWAQPMFLTKELFEPLVAWRVTGIVREEYIDYYRREVNRVPLPKDRTLRNRQASRKKWVADAIAHLKQVGYLEPIQ